MSVLKIKNTPSGAWQPIATIKGEKGDKGDVGGVTDAVKLALLQIANHVYYDNDQGPTYIQNLQDALFPPTDIVSITAVYTQSEAVYNTDDIDDLKADLVVTANKTGGTTQTVAAANYTLFGELDVGTSTITVIYRGYVTTFDVAVTREPNGLVNGTYTAVDGSGRANGGTATVSNNTIQGVDLVTYKYLDIPLQSRVKLKTGDVVEFANVAARPATAANNGITITFNGGNYGVSISDTMTPWRNPGLPERATITADFTATSIRVDTSARMNNSAYQITLQMTVNGEVIF